MKAHCEIQSGGVTITFDQKPPANILSALKASGFRWDGRVWWRRRVPGAADLITWINRKLDPQPDGPCWKCGAPGRFRAYGAATPVYCDDCEAACRAAQRKGA